MDSRKPLSSKSPKLPTIFFPPSAESPILPPQCQPLTSSSANGEELRRERANPLLSSTRGILFIRKPSLSSAAHRVSAASA